MGEVIDAGTELPPSLASAAWLTPWGTTFRYEDPREELDTEAAVEAATAAIAIAEETLSEARAD